MHKCVNNSIGNVYHLEQMVSDFFPYSQEKLGFDQPATIIFQSDIDNSMKMLGKTAYYDPQNYEVTLYVDGRHPKDIMRSLSHELVHHAQNCRGDFTGDNETGEGYAQKDPHLRKMEREAYTKGNLIFRDFEDLIKTGKINITIDFKKSGEPKMALHEWKNNELNSLLMKKWGLLKEDKEDLEEGGTAKEREDEEGNRPSFAKKMDLDEGELEEGHMHGPECGCPDQDTEIVEGGMGATSGGGVYRDDDKPMTNREKEEEIAALRSKKVGTPPPPGVRVRDPRHLQRTTAKLPAVKRESSQKISVREAKQITRKLIERLRKEGK